MTTDPDRTARRLESRIEPTDTGWSESMPWPGPGVRRDVAIEGVPTTDGRRILVKAIRFEHDPIPVTYRGRGYDPVGVVGKASKFKRSGEGVISAKIWIHPVYGEGIDLDLLNTHVEMDDSTIEVGDDENVFTSARLRGIFLSEGPSAWPSLNVVVEEPVDPIFTPPFNIGTTYGPGSATRSCTRCGAVVMDEPEMLDLHRRVHAQGWTR